MNHHSPRHGRLTLPIETGIDDTIRGIVERLHPDAVRNSDGTDLPAIARELVDTVYATYFPTRGDHAWSDSHPGERIHQYLMSEPVTAFAAEPLTIDVMRGYFAQQFAPELDCDTDLYWQVIDRTAGEPLPPQAYSIAPAPPIPIDREEEAHDSGSLDAEAASARVTVAHPTPHHVYTVNFLARQIWDSTQIYNYLTNDWAKDPGRRKDRPYDPAYPETWRHIREALADWLVGHPEVDVVRFTSFFYHFTLVFNQRAEEKYVDWFGYSAAVSVPALEDFHREYGYRLTPEDFVDEGFYNNPFRLPSPHFRDWLDFTSRRVSRMAADLVRTVHAEGREAIMFLGDNWIGTEPYGPYFPGIGLDGVVGSVGSAATCRMIADTPGVRYTEGRLLPYFFPDVFNDSGDPLAEANKSWLGARRAIIRHPLDRIGYGGYLSLAVRHPEFIDRVAEIVDEFRALHDEIDSTTPAASPVTVGIVNAWGALRTWQTHMVAHAKHYRECEAYIGVIEALAGLPFEVRWLTIDGLRDGVPAGVDVLLNVGTSGTAFSGGALWRDVAVQDAVRGFVARGGGFIGVGQPTATASPGRFFALADVLGVDQELHLGLQKDKYVRPTVPHTITADLSGPFDAGDSPDGVFSLSEETSELARTPRGLTAAAHPYGAGRAVYFSGLPYSIDNARVLHRAIVWAGRGDDGWADEVVTDNPAVEAAYYPQHKKILLANLTDAPQSGTLRGPDGRTYPFSIDATRLAWIGYQVP